MGDNNLFEFTEDTLDEKEYESLKKSAFGKNEYDVDFSQMTGDTGKLFARIVYDGNFNVLEIAVPITEDDQLGMENDEISDEKLEEITKTMISEFPATFADCAKAFIYTRTLDLGRLMDFMGPKAFAEYLDLDSDNEPYGLQAKLLADVFTIIIASMILSDDESVRIEGDFIGEAPHSIEDIPKMIFNEITETSGIETEYVETVDEEGNTTVFRCIKISMLLGFTKCAQVGGLVRQSIEKIYKNYLCKMASRSDEDEQDNCD